MPVHWNLNSLNVCTNMLSRRIVPKYPSKLRPSCSNPVFLFSLALLFALPLQCLLSPLTLKKIRPASFLRCQTLKLNGKLFHDTIRETSAIGWNSWMGVPFACALRSDLFQILRDPSYRHDRRAAARGATVNQEFKGPNIYEFETYLWISGVLLCSHWGPKHPNRLG